MRQISRGVQLFYRLYARTGITVEKYVNETRSRSMDLGAGFFRGARVEEKLSRIIVRRGRVRGWKNTSRFPAKSIRVHHRRVIRFVRAWTLLRIDHRAEAEGCEGRKIVRQWARGRRMKPERVPFRATWSMIQRETLDLFFCQRDTSFRQKFYSSSLV